jgi:hypothetical protein
MKNGFADSGIRMNTYIAQKENWGLAELEDRSHHLMNYALEIWAAPATTYKPAEKQLDSYTLDDDPEVLTGRTIARFSYKNAEQPVTSWVEMYQKVLQILYAEDKAPLLRLAESTEDALAIHFSLNAADFNKSVEIGDGLYVWTNTNTQRKLSVLAQIFRLYNADASDLVFYLRDENANAAAEAGTRYEVRRRYWNYALDFIKQAHSTNGAFTNVNASKENWISGTFGIRGFSLCCVATSDGARVELYLGKSETAANKAAFRLLLQHKNEIEAALGVSLQWSLGKEIKSSKVSYSLDGVSIENEVDWLQMARFQADWSKKFYDVIVPYLL